MISLCSKRELLSMAGLLSFAAKVVPPGRTFVRRLFNAAADMAFMDKQVAVPQEATEDIHWWSACCEVWNGRALFIDPNWTQASKVSLWIDASGLGFGIVFGNEWCCGTWSPVEEGYSIEWKELYPIVLAIAMWDSHLSGLRLTVRCDNEAVEAFPACRCNASRTGIRRPRQSPECHATTSSRS